MSELESGLRNALRAASAEVYEASADAAGNTACAMARDGGGRFLAVSGDAGAFSGEDRGGYRRCPLTNENAKALQALFPYTRPVSCRGRDLTIGLGDRLGLAAPGHVRAIAPYGAFPVLAQQSVRELTLTGRTFDDVIAAAAYGVFQAGYRGGYGADGDHLKTEEEIRTALRAGCTMITLDCSEQIDADAALRSDAEIDALWETLPAEVRERYEKRYLGEDLPFVGRISRAELRRIAAVFWRAVDHAVACYGTIGPSGADFELSIDETRTVTTPAEHLVIASELAAAGVRPDSVAPHFSGEFEKGIEYSGCLRDFARDFGIHQKIADRFGYRLSVHSGSDKFSVFSTVGRVTQGRVHVKTAGTNWLEAMALVAERDPALYRRAHVWALEHRPEAERYYHVSSDPSTIPDIDLQCDAYLPEYLKIPASRQTMHIAYGLLLQQEWFRSGFFAFMDRHEEEYARRLEEHIGRHLRYLTAYRDEAGNGPSPDQM